MQQSIVSGRTAGVKVWARDGTVIYSNDRAGVGEKFPIRESLLKALCGENAISVMVHEDAESERETSLGTIMDGLYTNSLPRQR